MLTLLRQILGKKIGYPFESYTFKSHFRESTINFIYQSLKDFLLEDSHQLQPHFKRLTHSNSVAYKKCIHLLSYISTSMSSLEVSLNFQSASGFLPDFPIFLFSRWEQFRKSLLKRKRKLSRPARKRVGYY